MKKIKSKYYLKGLLLTLSKLEEERLMLKVENMNNMVNVIDGIASSPSIPAKVNGQKFLQYWYSELQKNPIY